MYISNLEREVYPEHNKIKAQLKPRLIYKTNNIHHQLFNN